MKVICLNCTLKSSPAPFNTQALADVVLAALREEGLETDVVRVRLVDHRIDPGVVSEAVADGDEWPTI
jgi:multimeric flavodoxin WrbA